MRRWESGARGAGKEAHLKADQRFFR